MHLESVRGLKEQIFTEMIPRQAKEAYQSGLVHPKFASDLSAPSKLVPSIALGISQSRGEYLLAVRIQQDGLNTTTVLDQIATLARKEVDIRVVGRIEKRQRKPATIRRPLFIAPRVLDSLEPAAGSASPYDLQWYRQNTRPLQIGSSVGHVEVTAGTIGAFVAKAEKSFILSNNHILANEDEAGEGDMIVQRATLDGGKVKTDLVGHLDKWARFKRKSSNVVDAALATIDGIDFDPLRLKGIRNGRDARLAGLGPEFVDEGDRVFKIGRTTGATQGRVTAFDVDNVVVSYDTGMLAFDGQIEIEGAGRDSFSQGGDSGSLIVNRSMEAVALLFAGSTSGGRNGRGLTYANPIRIVLSTLGVELLS